MIRKSTRIAVGTLGVAAAAAVVIGNVKDHSEARDSMARSTAVPYQHTFTSAAPITVLPATSSPRRGESRWSGNGVFSVGNAPSGGAKAAIPPGRYTITMTDPDMEAVSVIRCSDLPCSESHNFLDADSGFGRGYTSVINILPTDGAVRLMNATLTAVR
ncbi:hypothetical protein [Nocardia sp. NPDC050793]|uniref:hypothetical protein n=1 Tax=Nocardia sp. NPDC050793 TaxID=3155159 RepID=UPI0033D72328